jgi:DNA polymerase III alpha subunit (gram-positive type)
MNQRMSNVVFLDIETTGTNSATDEILEIYAMRCHGESIYPTSMIHIMVRPERGINKEAQAINHIEDYMVKYADPATVALQDLHKYLREDDIIVGHNILDFDIKFMEAHGPKFTQKIVDTLTMAASLGFKRGERSLKKLSEHFQIKQPPSHRADDDVKALRLLYIEFQKMTQNKLPLGE